MMGAHVIKQGCSRFVIDLMERGLMTHVAMNGAGVDPRFRAGDDRRDHRERGALHQDRASSACGRETGRINDVCRGRGATASGWARRRTGDRARAVPHRDVSVCAAGYRLGVPVTVHVGDRPGHHPRAPELRRRRLGATSLQRLSRLHRQRVARLEGGVFLNFGTAVMGPEVYLKALSMARNVARQEGRTHRHFTTAVFDLIEPGRRPVARRRRRPTPRYYYRPCKTILVRTVADGGESFYVQGDHRVTVPEPVEASCGGRR